MKIPEISDIPSDILEILQKRPLPWIYLTGECGVGKTHMAKAILEFFRINNKVPSKFFQVLELLGEIKKDMLMTPEERTLNSWDSPHPLPFRLADFKGILVVDDLGCEKPSDWTDEQLMTIVDGRYSKNYPVIFTSNLKPEELGARYGNRIASRISERSVVVDLSGKNFRKEI